MKIAMTGHTGGLGEILREKYPDLTGFSRSTGFDIDKPNDRRQIISTIQDYDVFINAACTDNCSELKLLYELYATWKDKQKLIINIGSAVSAVSQQYPNRYAANKTALAYATKNLGLRSLGLPDTFPCQVSILNFGWIDTKKVREKYNPSASLVKDEVIDVFDFMISNFRRFRIVDMIVVPI